MAPKAGRPRTRFISPSQLARAMALRDKGITRRRVARDLGVDYQLLCSELRKEKR